MNEAMCLAAVGRADIREIAGHKSNPRILTMLRAVIPKFRGTDRTAWCSAWMLEVALAAGADLGDKYPNAAAISWRRVGVEIPFDDAMPGDVAILSRPGAADWQRHVGMLCRYVTRTQILVLGGNQRNRSGFKRFPITRLQNVRRLVS